MGDVVVGVVFEVGFVLLVVLEVDLVVLEDSQGLLEAAGDLLADEVEGVGGDVELLEFFR